MGRARDRLRQRSESPVDVIQKAANDLIDALPGQSLIDPVQAAANEVVDDVQAAAAKVLALRNTLEEQLRKVAKELDVPSLLLLALKASELGGDKSFLARFAIQEEGK